MATKVKRTKTATWLKRTTSKDRRLLAYISHQVWDTAIGGAPVVGPVAIGCNGYAAFLDTAPDYAPPFPVFDLHDVRSKGDPLLNWYSTEKLGKYPDVHAALAPVETANILATVQFNAADLLAMLKRFKAVTRDHYYGAVWLTVTAGRLTVTTARDRRNYSDCTPMMHDFMPSYGNASCGTVSDLYNSNYLINALMGMKHAHMLSVMRFYRREGEDQGPLLVTAGPDPYKWDRAAYIMPVIDRHYFPAE